MDDNTQPTQPQEHVHEFLDYPDGRHCPCGELAPESEAPKSEDAPATEEVTETVSETPTQEVEAQPQPEVIEETTEPVVEEVASDTPTEESTEEVEEHESGVDVYFDTILNDLDRMLVSLHSFKSDNSDVVTQSFGIALELLDLSRGALKVSSDEIRS